MAKKDSQRILEIREKANQQRREQQRAEKRKNTLIQVGVIGGILVIAAAVVFGIIFAQSNRTLGPAPAADGTISLLGSSGIPMSVGDNAVTLGASNAPVTIDLYEDYSCPHCADYAAAVGPTLNQLVVSGDAVVNYHPIQFVTRYGLNAGSAAACVATNDSQNWPGFHAALFTNHSQASDGWGAQDFADFAEALGITDKATLKCIASNSYADWITANTAASKDAGVTGTPSLYINGEATQLLGPAELQAAVDAAKK